MADRPLSNSDFRTIMMTPRREPTIDTSSSNPMAPPKEKPKKKKWKPQKPRKIQQFDPEDGGEEEPEFKLDTSKYRDRAEERRKGVNTDYQDDEALKKLETMTEEDDATEKEKKEKLIEQSKFLGGDMDHTHLVKGLDFALLQKVKHDIAAEEKRQKKEKKLEQQVKREQEEGEVKAPKPKEKKLHFNTRVAKMVHYQLFGKTTPKTTDHFLPGRSYFVFDLSPNAKSDLPTTLVQSREDLPTLKQPMCYSVEDEILDSLDSILSYLRGTPPKRKKVQEKKAENGTKSAVAEPTPQPEVVEEEEDIFADPVSEAPTFTKPGSLSENAEKKGSYFGDKKDDMELEMPQLPAVLQKQIEMAKYTMSESNPEPPVSLSAAALEEQAQKISLAPKTKKRKEPENREKDPTFISDNYAECYPGTYEASFAVMEGESDEEDDISKMDTGKKGRLHRYHFDSEEAWSAYNEKREALPKAAFQFGVKMSDGRKTKKNQGKSKERKFDQELKKINDLIKKKENLTAPNVPTALEVKKKKLKTGED